MTDATPTTPQPRILFVNLPVAELPRATAFYAALGFRQDMAFSNDSAAAMVWSETIRVMLLTHATWATFTSRPITPATHGEVMLCLSCESRAEVDRLTEAAGSAGGLPDINPPQDHGFMFGRSFADPDGHIWELVWMDMSAVPATENAS